MVAHGEELQRAAPSPGPGRDMPVPSRQQLFSGQQCVWQQAGLRGRSWGLSIPLAHSPAEQKQLFTLSELKQRVPGHIHCVGRDGSSELTPLWHTGL